MNYYQISVQVAPEKAELLMAELFNAAAEAFVETEDGFEAYIASKDYNPDTEQQIRELINKYDGSFSSNLIQDQNWNAQWEASFSPIIVDQFCGIRAGFHNPIPNVEYELIIDPKMAFGTGHHATTYMCIKLMEDLPIANASVLDYGCGTGILAILAAKMGAKKVFGIDNDPKAVENALENKSLNATPDIEFEVKTLEKLQAEQFDIILANINRNVLLDSMEALSHHLPPKGSLIISGFIASDEPIMKNAIHKQQMRIRHVEYQGEWCCMLVGLVLQELNP